VKLNLETNKGTSGVYACAQEHISVLPSSASRCCFITHWVTARAYL